jgi:phosphohistidine swiveling domain-containing protein
MRLLKDSLEADLAEVGGKARNLARLLHAGFPVPGGWVVPVSAFRAQLAGWGIDLGCPAEVIMGKIRHGDLTPGLRQQLAALPDVPLAVRSSALVEDGASASYSGVFDTVLGVRGKQPLEAAVRQVSASAFTPEALAYHRQVSKTDEFPLMAVLLMPMVDAMAAGVAFSAHPVDGNPFVIAISASHGLGTTVVSGRSPVDRYLLDWDTLAVAEVCENGRAARGRAVLDDKTLGEIGRLVRDADRLFDTRIGVEFAVTPEGVVLLQASPVIGLPPYFPDDPRSQSSTVFCCHSERMDPLSPYALANLEAVMHAAFPTPPWPMEVRRFLARHGRLFGECPEDAEVTERPEAPEEDRGFIGRMLLHDSPELALREWYAYADLIYRQAIPELRRCAERVLRLQSEELRDLSQDDFARLLQDVMRLDNQAGALYLATSYPTYETLRRIDILIRDSLQLPWLEAQQLALTMIQGAPKLTHLRDAEVEEAARTGEVDDVIAHWGYSYLRRDELLDISTWKSWREDPTPLGLAMANRRKLPSTPTIAERVRLAAAESDARFAEILEAIRASAHGGTKYADVFAACVGASRRLFPLKDDRDLVSSHAQSAVRWALLEAGRRLKEAGCMAKAEDVFMLHPDEILAGVGGRCEPGEMADLVAQRREQQWRLARYTPPQAPPSPDEVSETPADVFQGWPASAGVAEGPLRIVTTDSPDEIAQLQPGEILWLRGEAKVGWTMYFPIIAGLICEFGSWLCHETNLCRELGIPAIVGMRDIPEVRTGDLVRIDGGKGAIALVQRRQDKGVAT